MRRLIGVTGFRVWPFTALKQKALLFDQVFDISYWNRLALLKREGDLDGARELEWLSERGVIGHFRSYAGGGRPVARRPHAIPNPPRNAREAMELELALAFDHMQEEQPEAIAIEGSAIRPNPFTPTFLKFGSLHLRFDAANLCSTNVDARPLFPEGMVQLAGFFPGLGGTEATDVAHVVLKELPVPDDATSWEDILAFREDPESRNTVTDLRRWMGQIGRENLSEGEMSDALDWHLSRYRRRLELHRMKIGRNLIETAVLITAEVAESLSRFKLSDAARALFGIRKTKLDIMEAELSTPEACVAYILKAHERFSR